MNEETFYKLLGLDKYGADIFLGLGLEALIVYAVIYVFWRFIIKRNKISEIDSKVFKISSVTIIVLTFFFPYLYIAGCYIIEKIMYD